MSPSKLVHYKTWLSFNHANVCPKQSLEDHLGTALDIRYEGLISLNWKTRGQMNL